jgi:asparagine synthase (glutamine-hydrolysing)
VSSIVGIVNWDDTPVDPRVLSRMTEALARSGPDGQHVWLGGAVGLGHASLRVPREAPPETQPLSLDGTTWIAADARIDGRAELVHELTAHGCQGVVDATDAALILHAYRVWGEACVGKLLGDFAFAIWDGARRRLFCARDHFGVKPLFYAEGRQLVVFSSSLDCVRLHPGVSSALDDRAIADFLRDGALSDPAMTCFSHIRRVEPAHVLIGEAGLHTRRYWRLPVDGEIRYARDGEYVEHFRDLLERAVTDRLHGRAIGVLMSGGLDSTTVAATAKRGLSRNPAPFDLRAYTTVCRRLVSDPEPRYAQLVADALSIPIHYRVVDDYRPFERRDRPELSWPEPEGDPLLAVHVDQLSDAAVNGRVLLTGHGGDPAMRVPVSYAIDLVKRREIGRLVAEVARYVRHCRRLPRVRLGTHARRWVGLRSGLPEGPPGWLRPPFRERPAIERPASPHPKRPHAYELLTSPEWPQIFESYDANVTRVPVEVRHPLFDRRLVEYLLAVPPMPWCFDKTILRLATCGALPEAIRRRPKTVAVGDPLVALLQGPEAAWVDRFVAAPGLHRYVDRRRVPGVCGEREAGAVWTNLRPLCLDQWLRSQDALWRRPEGGTSERDEEALPTPGAQGLR